ncbi:PAS domain-containing sensor histidine kinase [Clostridium sp.]|uniref:sensor histidine kinase n=1 Tax=Clostridium sp. TaxID=1506 RepID=UPI00283AFD65|nr:PAS domain-containing sensor histidine kinase [Clostridium sp.]MDR3597300.1 PAS domain-containing sensor histidine kinase [Clostridium sp.]
MENNLGIVICENFIEEIKYILEDINEGNVIISPFASVCTSLKNGLSDSIIEAIKRCETKCDKIIIIVENSYDVDLTEFITNGKKYEICNLENYFDLFVNKHIISNFLNEKLYLVTSGYLKNLKDNTNYLTLTKEYNKIRLLDTGIYEGALEKLQELAKYLNLPYDSIFIGFDFFRMFIEKIILEWKLECETKEKLINLETPFYSQYKELKTREKIIENKKRQLLYILDSIYEGVFILDSNYKILFINRGVERLLCLESLKSILGKNLFDINIIHNDYRKIVFNRLTKVIKDNVSAPIHEEKLITYDGNIITVNIYSEAIEYEGNMCILSVVRDITEEKKAENLKLKIQEQSELLDKAAEYDKLKTEFFANLSHEFRTPLNVMLSSLQLLNVIEVNEAPMENKAKIKKYYHIMKQNCYRLLRLVNNLIDITKIEAKYFKLNLKNEDIIAIVEDITLSVTDYAKNKGLNIIFDTDTEERIIACDADKIERIVLNLLSNAIKFTPVGGNIFVSIAGKDSTIIIYVKDNGVGIPLDNQASIFKRFIQVDKSLSRNREGSGIGLSLVKSLVELHNGTIKLVSEDGKGSEFIIELPATILPESENTISDENLAKENNIQRINIEFSDIYD